jgi:hypothetical protein
MRAAAATVPKEAARAFVTSPRYPVRTIRNRRTIQESYRLPFLAVPCPILSWLAAEPKREATIGAAFLAAFGFFFSRVLLF